LKREKEPEQGKSQAIALLRHDNYRLIKRAYSKRDSGKFACASEEERETVS